MMAKLHHVDRAISCSARKGRVLLVGSLLATLFSLSPRVTAAEAKKPPVEIKIRNLDPQAAAAVSFTRDIKPIFANECYDCHSAEDRKGGLDMTDLANLYKKGKKAGPPVVPHQPDESALVQYIRGQHEPQMPKGNPTLSEDELHLIRLWIFAGAVDDTGKVAENKNKNATTSARLLSTSDPATQEALNKLMFSGNNRERLVAQRVLRTALLPAAPVPPKVKSATFNPIDQFIAATWEAAGGKEAKTSPRVCDDATFVRRAYLDVVGVIPTVAEAQKFLKDRAPDKRARLVDALLARNEDYAAHWTPFWEDALASSDVDKQGGIATHGSYRRWIYDSFATNKPYDVLVAELMDPLMPGYQKPIISSANGKPTVASFVRNDTHEHAVESAADTAQVFLGTGMKCASCHNHFLNKEWPQSRFMAFAGMFATNDLELIRCEKKSGNYVAAKFPFELPSAPDDTPEGMEERLHRMTLLLVDPTNPRFAKTMVNRLWKRYVGIGLFAPLDDFRLDQPAAQPELLDWLADDFIRHGYDFKHTIRLILTSRTYQLRYDPTLEDHFDVAKPTLPRYYRSPSLRRMTAEQFLDSIRVATTQTLDAKKRSYLEKSSTALTRALGKPASRNEVSTARAEDVAVVQALELLNGEDFFHLVNTGNILDPAVAEQQISAAIDQLYWIAYSRPATRKEQKLSAAFLQSGGDAHSLREPLGDMLWALFTSPEFQYIH